MRTWTQAEDARIHGLGGEEEDTDWPERPTRHIRAEGNDTDDSDPSYSDDDIDD